MAVEHLLLALLADAPDTGYALKKRIDRDLAPVASAEFSQIYPALGRLKRAGFVSVRVGPPERGPRRYRYRITSQGRREIRRWFAEPFSPPDLRDDSLLRLLLAHAQAEELLPQILAGYEGAISEALLRSRRGSPVAPLARSVRSLTVARLDALRRFVRGLREPISS